MLRSFTYFFFLLTALLLSACGGGSNEEAGKTSSPTLKLQGLASDGTALGNKKVILKGANGRLIRVTTSSEGVFTISNARLQPLGFPLLIQLATDDKTFLYSIATEDGYININPLTDLVIRNWFLSNGLDIDAEFPVSAPPPAPELNRVAKIQSLPGKQQLSSLRAVVSRLLERIYSSYRIKSEYDFFTKKFEIGPFEFNAILSYLKFDRKLDRLSMSYIEPTIGLEGKLLSDYDLTQALDSEDTQAPSIPTGLIARANQPSKVLLYWESSLDNKGVAGYRVFPDVVLIDFKDEIVSPPFLISGLTKNTEYCFTIKAIDSSNNLSEASSPVCVTTLQNEDGIGPANLSAPILVEKTDTRLALEWSASTEEDFLAYQLFLREGESPVRIKTLFNNGHVVENLRPSTRYCYQLKALDNSLNESGFTEQTCIVTHGEDTMAPETLISVPSRSYTQTKTIELLCVDEGYSGCSETYYTLDGSKPTTESLLYSQPLEISTDTTLRYFSVDNLGNTEEEKTANYSITIPNIPKRLTVVRNSATGVLSSNVGNINCGPVCEDSYSPNTLVTLTASNYSGLTPSWSGCFPSEDLSSCTITMKADSRVTINFLTTVNEATQNDTASPETQLIAAASLVSGHFDSQADVDYYRLKVSEPGLFQARLSHPSIASRISLYQNTYVIHQVGDGNLTSLMMSSYLMPGDYYLKVEAYEGGIDGVIPYTIAFTGGLMGELSPDENEPNDTPLNAVQVNSEGVYHGFFDARDDRDYYEIRPATQGVLRLVLSHDRLAGVLRIIEDGTQVFTSGGLFNKTQVLSYTLQAAKTYHIVVESWGNHEDLLVPYQLEFYGSALGGDVSDVWENNDSAESATTITSEGLVSGYFDSSNDKDYYEINPGLISTLFVEIDHQRVASVLDLYENGVLKLRAGDGVSRKVSLNYTLRAGETYHVLVQSHGTSFDDINPYTLTFSGTALGGAEPDPFEQNDLPDNAVAVDSEGSLQGYFSTGNDADYFVIQPSQYGTLQVKLEHEDLASTLKLFEEDVLIASSGGSLSKNHELSYTVQAGVRYYILAESFSYGSDLVKPYTLTFKGTALGGLSPDPYEQNDTLDSAVLVDTERQIFGFFDTGNDKDYFTITPAIRGTLIARLTHPNIAGTLTLLEDGVPVVSKLDKQKSQTIAYKLEAGKTYNLLVESFSQLHSVEENYTLTLEGTALGGTGLDKFEENDTPSEAKQIGLNTKVDAYFDTPGDIDYFYIQVDKNGALTIALSYQTQPSVPLETILTLYNDKNEAINVSKGKEHSVSISNARPGIYRISIQAQGSDFNLINPYTLETIFVEDEIQF